MRLIGFFLQGVIDVHSGVGLEPPVVECADPVLADPPPERPGAVTADAVGERHAAEVVDHEVGAEVFQTADSFNIEVGPVRHDIPPSGQMYCRFRLKRRLHRQPLPAVRIPRLRTARPQATTVGIELDVCGAVQVAAAILRAVVFPALGSPRTT
ncbi:hypothetical protein [Streptomyces sp. NPDC007205]|uniref:hypothetical protein n=1 Tax=Streptomyces sp. NPDC007205 TaxID=3154316 RepID=UPI0033FBD95A